MLKCKQRLRFIVIPFLMLLVPSFAHSALLLDGGFEDVPVSDWSLSGNASIETSPTTLINGSQALKLSGNFDPNGPYTVAFQHVLVDGTDFSVGDVISLSGLIGHLSTDSLTGDNVAYLEIAFAYSENDINTVDFGNGAISQLLNSTFATDSLLQFETSSIEIPAMVLGQAISSIRIAAALFQPNVNDLGSAWFDDLSLQVVPESSSIMLFCVAIAGLTFKRRLKA